MLFNARNEWSLPCVSVVVLSCPYKRFPYIHMLKIVGSSLTDSRTSQLKINKESSTL